MKRFGSAIVSLVAIGLAIAAFGAIAAPAAGETNTTTGDIGAGTTVSAWVPENVAFHTDVEASGCDNSPGPFITVSGELALGGLGIRLIFQNNVKGTHTHVEESTASVVVLPAGESITIPKQPSQGGVGGNSFIWIQFTDADGNALSGEIFLGRCVQGLFAADASFVIAALASATVEGGSCSNHGSSITLSGELSLSGVNAVLIFRNNVKGPHEHDEPVTASVVLVPAGMTIQFPKQPSLGGVGGNPWIYLEFTDVNGNPVSERFLLGRCVQDF